MVGRRGARIGRREGDENVAGAVAGDTAVAPEAKRNAASEAFKLVRDKRRIGGHHNDDGTAVQFVE